MNNLRKYQPGDIAECFTYGLDDNQTTYKFYLRLIEKVREADENVIGQELWTTLNISFNEYNRDTPLDELDWDEVGEPQLCNILTNEEYLTRLNRMAKEGISWMAMNEPTA